MHNSEQDNINSTLEKLRDKIRFEMPDNPLLSGWASYSQCDEDGIIRECLSRISKKTALSKTCIEIGCANGLENNTHQLLLDGYSGFWVDGNREEIQFIENNLGGLHFDKLCVHESFVTRDNIVSLVEKALRFLGTKDLDFFSLDVDGNDIHLLPMIFQLTAPKLICVEYNAKFVPPTRLAMAYRSDHTWAGDDYFGASLQSWVDELSEYSLVCCNLSGANAFFIRNDLAEGCLQTPIDKLYQPPRYWLTACSKGHKTSLKWLTQEMRKDDKPVNNPLPRFGNPIMDVGEMPRLTEANAKLLSLRALASHPVHEPGATVEYAVEIRNDSPHSLRSGGANPINIAYHWYKGEHCVIFDGARSRLASPVKPGTHAVNSARVTTPTEPGKYRLVIALVQEAVAWLDDPQRSISLEVEVRDTAASGGARRPPTPPAD